MDLPVKHEAFTRRPLTVRSAGFCRGPQLFCGGREVTGKKNVYSLPDDHGTKPRITLKISYVDPVPKLQMDDEQPMALAGSIAWYEYLWTGLPLILVMFGGAIGGLLGVLAVWTNLGFFRSERGPIAKYLLSGVVSSAATVTFLTIAIALEILLGQG
jgi:hypothetical protein